MIVKHAKRHKNFDPAAIPKQRRGRKPNSIRKIEARKIEQLASFAAQQLGSSPQAVPEILSNFDNHFFAFNMLFKNLEAIQSMGRYVPD